MKRNYLFNENQTGKPVRWYVDLSSIEVEALTAEEAHDKAIELIKKDGVEICNVELQELQEKGE